jgi:hypothetical protein
VVEEVTMPDGTRPAADRWIEALLGARLRFHAGPGGGAFDPAAVAYWGRVYKRWSQLYHRLYDPASYGAD